MACGVCCVLGVWGVRCFGRCWVFWAVVGGVWRVMCRVSGVGCRLLGFVCVIQVILVCVASWVLVFSLVVFITT